MQKFIKYTRERVTETETVNVTHYQPLFESNIYRFSHVKSVRLESKEGEEPKQVVVEFVGLESNIIAEQPQIVPLKYMKRIKQTKSEEYFLVDEVVKSMQPLLEKIEKEEEFRKLLDFLESNTI